MLRQIGLGLALFVSVSALGAGDPCDGYSLVGKIEARTPRNKVYDEVAKVSLKEIDSRNFKIESTAGDGWLPDYVRRYDHIRFASNSGYCYLLWISGGGVKNSNVVLDASEAKDYIVLGGDFETYPQVLIKRVK